MHLLPGQGVADMQSDEQNISRAKEDGVKGGQGRKES